MTQEKTMEYFKYVAPVRDGCPTRVAGIKPDNYSSRLPQILAMAAIAKADFPGLTDADIRTVAYDGDRWKRQTGIEFTVSMETTVPAGYTEVSKLEFVFAGN